MAARNLRLFCLNVMRLLDDVRQRFAELRFMHKGQSFAVTLSAGIATTEQCADAQALIVAADAALYAAKQGEVYLA